METTTRGAATAPALTVPRFWHAELIPFGLVEGPPTYRQIDYPGRGPAAWSAVPLPLLWEPDGIAAHTEPIQVGTVDRFSVGLAALEASGMIRVLSGAGCLDLDAPGFRELVAAAVRCGPYGHGYRLVGGPRPAGFMLGVRADLVDVVTDPAALANKPAIDYTVASVTITTAPPFGEGTYLRLDDIPHEYK